MMILTRLHVENFKKYKIYEIEFGQGLIGIIGKNGSGKSTLFEAILFALYGELKIRGEKELVRHANATNKEAVVVILEFEFENIEYKVAREFRGKNMNANAKFYKNEVLTCSGVREVTTAITALTKMSKDAFMHTLFASQKELTSLSTLKNEDRKKMIRRLLGLEKIDFIEKELIEKSRELKRSITAFDELLLGEEELATKQKQLQEIKTLQELLTKEQKVKSLEIEKIKKEEQKLKKELAEFVKTKEKKAKAQSEIELLKSRLNADQTNLTKLKAQLQELKQKAKELEKLLHVKDEYIKLQETLKIHEHTKEQQLKKEGLQKEQMQLREQYTKAKNDIRLLTQECSKFDELLTQEQKEQKNLEEFKNRLAQSLTKDKELNARLSAEKRIISDTEAKIQKIQNLGASSACPTCTRPLLEEYDNVLHILQKSIEEIQKSKIEKFESEIEKLQLKLKEEKLQSEAQEKKLQILSNQIALIKSKQNDLTKANEYFKSVKKRGLCNKGELEKLGDILYDVAIHQKLQEQLPAVKKSYEHLLSLETELKRQKQLNQEHTELSEKLQETQKIVIEKESAFGVIEYDASLHSSKEKALETLTKTKDEEQAILHKIELNIENHKGETKAIETTLENNNAQLKKVQTKKEDLKEYEKIKLSLVDFKTKLNAKVAPRISDTASKMYAQITKGKYQHIEVNNDFDFFIYDDGKKYPIERFSGGEIDLANLVLRIAISKTLTELSGANSIGFLAFDEVFGSQDESRRMEILEAFHTIKEQYRQIFLISHEMEIKEMFELIVEL